MITFYHTADIHFGVENYGKIDPQTGIHSRLLDFKHSLAQCVDSAIKENIDFFLFSGDAYKTAYPTPTQQKLLMQEFFKLQRASIPVVIIIGNHDHPLSFGKANALDVFAELPLEGFHVFSKPDLRILETKSGPVQIVGIPWPTRHNVITKEEHRHKKTQEVTAYIAERVSEIIADFATKVDPDIPAVLSGHLTVSNGIFSGSEKCAIYGNDPLFLPSQLALPMFDYVALGHLHRYQNLNQNGYPPLVYAGSIDRVDFGERKETKGYCKVSIATDCSPQTEDTHQYTTKSTFTFIPLQTRPFVQIEVKLESGTSQTGQILKAIEGRKIKDAIVKLIYHVPEGKQDKVDLLAVQRACREAMYLVGVIPIHKPAERVRRAAIKVDMDFATMIANYIDTRDDLKEIKGSLLEKAQKIYDEVEGQS